MRFAALTFAAGLAGCQWLAGDFELAPPERGAPCSPGEVHCDGGKLLSCGPELRFVLLEDCGRATACDPSALACRPCAPGERACDGKNLLVCDASGWRVEEECATPELCAFSAGRASGACVPPLCEEDEHQCSGSALLRCSRSRDRFELLELCASDEHCDAEEAARQAAAGEGARCLPACEGDCPQQCKPGAKRCGGDFGLILEHCNADGIWTRLDACYSAAFCRADLGACLPPACRIGEDGAFETRCRGQRLERCVDQLTHFELERTCDASEACDVEMGCVARVPCPELTFRCNGRTLERCENGAFQPYLVCDTAELCNAPAGACGAPLCFPGTYRCDEDNNLDRCSDGGHDWIQDIETCPDATTTCTPYFDTSDTDNACVPN